MSLMRSGQQTKYEDCHAPYVYFAAHGEGSARLTGLDGATEQQFIEVVMQALDQSGKLTEDELENTHKALRTRLRVDE